MAPGICTLHITITQGSSPKGAATQPITGIQAHRQTNEDGNLEPKSALATVPEREPSLVRPPGYQSR